MADKKKDASWWDMLTMKDTQKALDKAKSTGNKKYTAPDKAQSTSYLQKQIERQEKLKKKKEDAALKALAGK